MRILAGCSAAIGFLAVGSQAAPVALNVPSVTYKESLEQAPVLPKFDSFEEPASRPVLPSPVLKRSAPGGRRHNFRMQIAEPKGGVAYKLTVIPADPSIDPKMLVEVPGSERALGKQGPGRR